MYNVQEVSGSEQGGHTHKKQKKKSIFAQQFSRKNRSESEHIDRDAGETADIAMTGGWSPGLM